MVGGQERSVNQAVVSARAGGLNPARLLMGALLVLIAVLAIATVVAAASMGQTTVALVTALVAGAFFCGLLC